MNFADHEAAGGAHGEQLHQRPAPHRRNLSRTRPRPQVARPHRLPVVRNSFVGRARDREQVMDRLRRSQVVTLVGPGGVGKTRLAVEVAARVAEGGRPVAFVDLAPLPDRDAVLAAMATALGVQGDPRPCTIDTVLAHVADDVLVVLDNCEHLLACCSQVVDALAGTCPTLRILATSRQRLGIADELVWPVGPLTLPDSDPGAEGPAFGGSEAVQLFCERAEALRPGFVPSSDQVVAIAGICRRLDGNPLAIELAATWVNALSPEDIAAHLEDRFGLLTRGASTAPPRHQSLRAALDWSYGLLCEAERVLLARLSVFAGGFRLEAAREVCGYGEVEYHRVLDVLSALVDKSLVAVDNEGGDVRYRLLETVRAYAADRLGDAEAMSALRERHATWCLTLVEGLHGDAVGQGERASVEQLEAEQDNVRAAIVWALSEGRVEQALRLVTGQMQLWQRRGCFEEAKRWLERALAAGDGPAELEAAAHHDAGFAALVMGDFDAARAHLQASVARWDRAGDRTARARSKSLLSFVSAFGDGPSGVEDLEADVVDVRETGNPVCLFEVLNACGQARMVRGEPHLARRHFHESVAVARELGDDCLIPAGLVGLGAAELAQGDYTLAEADLHEAVERAAAADDDHTEVVGQCWLGELHRLRGEYGPNRARLEQCLGRSRPMGAPYPLAMSLLGLGRAVLESGDARTAQDHFREAVGVAGSAGLAHVVAAALIGQGEVATAMGDAEAASKLFDQAAALARRRGDRAATASCSYHLGRLARAGCNLEQAASLHLEALTSWHQIGDRAGLAASLEALAGLAVARRSDDTAARLFGAAQALRQDVGCARSHLERSTYDADVERLGRRMTTDRLGSAWAQGTTLSPADVLAVARKSGGCGEARPCSGWDALTLAERRVANLVAQGLSNAEVAERLFVSPETVKTQVSKVLTKLGMRSRRELRGATEPDG